MQDYQIISSKFTFRCPVIIRLSSVVISTVISCTCSADGFFTKAREKNLPL